MAMLVPPVLHMWETTPAEKWSAGSLTITLRFLVDECGSAKNGGSQSCVFNQAYEAKW